jgi:hypothetical protein
MSTSRSAKQKTPAERGPKARLSPPPRTLGRGGSTKAPKGDHGTGEFTGQGQPALEKR